MEEGVAFLRSIMRPDTGQLRARATFHDQMAASFDLDEIRQICFDLDVRFDELPGKTLTDKARDLYLYMEKRGDLYRLAAVCQSERPGSNWTIT